MDPPNNTRKDSEFPNLSGGRGFRISDSPKNTTKGAEFDPQFRAQVSPRAKLTDSSWSVVFS